jgi:hypothetical protein
MKLVLVIYALSGPGGVTVPMQTTVMPGTYSACPGNVTYTDVRQAPDVRVGVICVPAGVAGKN